MDAHARRPSRAVAVMRLSATLLIFASQAFAAITTIADDAAFESEIMMSSNCWAVLFTSSTRDVDEAIKITERLGASLPGLSIATADVDAVKAVCSEFNVRKRMIPRLLVFNSRARQASIVKMVDTTLDEVLAQVKAELTENTKSDDGNYEKLTLAIGGGGGDEAPQVKTEL